jgi:hypothetical protein
MSKDFFKVKKGLHIKPSDPSTLTDLEDGDIIVDSTDNQLKKYSEEDGEFATIAGSGGSSGNIMQDIEKLTPTVTNVVATTDTVTFLPIEDNNKSVKAVFSGSDGSIRYDAACDASLDGVEGSVKVWIKTALDNLTIVATKDGVAQNEGLTINSTDKWRQYEIPVVLGDADYGFEVQASGSVAGDVHIDEGFVKVEKQIQIEEVTADLTAATANELSASVTSAASITSQNYNYLSNCVNNFAGSYTCNFEAALFSESPSCVVTTESDGILAAISATSTSSLTVRTRRHDNSPLNAAFKLHCSKQGADVNKSFVGAVIKESSISQTKCQTKFLSLNRTSDVTNEPDLRFNNLTIGKKYELNLSFRSQRSSTGTDNIGLVINHNSSIVLDTNHSHANAGGTSVYQTGASSKFTASTTEITTNLTSISTNSLVKGGDNRSSTWIELCQLPDTVIDTDEW